VYLVITRQLDACRRVLAMTPEGAPVTLVNTPLALPTSSDFQPTPFEMDTSKTYVEDATFPGGAHGLTDVTVFEQGEKVGVVSFGEMGGQDAQYFLSLASAASRRMTP
jgi:hypothetical protein